MEVVLDGRRIGWKREKMRGAIDCGMKGINEGRPMIECKGEWMESVTVRGVWIEVSIDGRRNGWKRD